MKKLASIIFGIAVVLTPLTIINLPPSAIAAHEGDYKQGYDQGYPEGYRRGYHDGSEGRRSHYHPDEGYDPYTRGLHDGRHDGYQSGYRDGRRGVNPEY